MRHLCTSWLATHSFSEHQKNLPLKVSIKAVLALSRSNWWNFTILILQGIINSEMLHHQHPLPSWIQLLFTHWINFIEIFDLYSLFPITSNKNRSKKKVIQYDYDGEVELGAALCTIVTESYLFTILLYNILNLFKQLIQYFAITWGLSSWVNSETV